MVDYPIGDLIAERVRAMGVTPFYKHFAHDGVRGPNMATVYSDRGFGVRAPGRLLQPLERGRGPARSRATSTGRQILAGGVRWFHSGGIFAALSPTTPELIIEAMKAAKAQGAVVSFDLNFREKLWKISGGAERAVEVVRRIVENVDVLVGNEEDLQKGLGIPGPEVAAKSKLDPSAFFGMIDKVIAKHPQVKVVATTLREVHSTSRHSWSAVAWIDGKTLRARRPRSSTCSTASAAATASPPASSTACSTGEAPEEAVKLGWAHGALLTTFPGDTTMATVEQVRAFAKGGSARIQR